MKSKQKQTPTEIIDNQRQAVVEKIIEDMKRDGLRWAEPYLPSLTPHNPVSGTVYQGGNRVHLGFIGFMRGYTDNRWATFNQIKDAGWHVKKGAKSALIEKWKQFAFYKENEDTGEKELAGRYPKLVGYWNVFNAEDIEGIPPENAPVHLNDRTATIAQNLEESSRCPVIESSGYLGSAAYSPATDRILIAPRETFRSDEAFTRVLLHEMTHSTGHPSALARELDTRFGSPSYAEEELVAELGSLFLSADLGIQSTDLEGRIASERSTLLALLAVHHPRPRLERRIASETPTLLAQRRHAGAVRAHHVASLPKYQRARGGIRDQGHRINSYANTRMPATDRVSCVRETTYGEVPLKTK